MSDGFECELGPEADGRRVITVRGEVDLATAPELEAGIRNALDGGTRSVVLDLDGLTFIDSSGLRVLVSLKNDAESRQAALTLRNVPRHARRVLEVTGLSDWFDAPPAD